MKKTAHGILFSATDLCNYLECPHLTTLGLKDLATPLRRDPRDEEAELIAKHGLVHEEGVFKRLGEEGKQIEDLTVEYATDEERLRKTIDHLKCGGEVLFQAFLMAPPFHGYADFLIKTNRPSDLGKFSYEVMDAKLARHTKPYYIIQLALYSELLAGLQGVMPEHIHVALGDGRYDRYRLKDFQYYFRHLKRQFLAHVESPCPTYPDPTGYCDRCDFRSLCQKQRIADDHLSQVANIRRSQIKRLGEVNVTTVEALAKLKATHVKGIGNETLSRLQKQAELQVYKRNTDQNKHVILTPTKQNLSLRALPEPDEGDLFYDIEGDPMYPDGLEYLHGAFYRENGTDVFRDFWSHNHTEERASFEELIRFFMDRLKEYPGMHIYHYASYEQTALKRLMSKYGSMEAEVDELLRRGVLVDLYRFVRHNLLVSEPSYSIKYLEHFYMRREAEVTSAGASIVYYERYIATKEQKLLDAIRSYNLEDCKSLPLLRDWLHRLRDDQPPMPAVHEQLTEEDERRKTERDERRAEYLDQLAAFEKALTDGLPDNPAEYTEPQRVNKLVFDLADFYRREAKPSWWRMFERQAMTSEELIDDGECIGGLVLCDPPPFAEKRSMVYTYRFPDQDFKLKVGEPVTIAETLVSGGQIYSLDEGQNTIQLKRGNKAGEMPFNLDIIPGAPISTDKLHAALWQFIKDYIEAIGTERRPYPALLDLIERGRPRIKMHTDGKPLIEPKQPKIPDYLDLVWRMDETCLFIQGPPGTGKTYTASHLILGLIKAGKKVGVTANSHKVIHNLLDSVEERAEEADFEFYGIKKGSWTNEDSSYDGKFIETVGTGEEVAAALGRANLVAGTAWLFADLPVGQLDYLFIDEAGQLSLAHFIAAGTAARNVILIGDQMQLAQPIQGVHPGESGQSVLDYLLQGRNTIPPDEGILLETTYRMHPKVCGFISDAIYDSRLHSLPGLERQAIVFDGKPFHKAAKAAQEALLSSAVDGPGCLPQAGIVCDFVDHEDSVQRSDEEAERVRKWYEWLLTLEYDDKTGKRWHMTPENILVVSPYNMQVNNLKRTLGQAELKGQAIGNRARVGTVDKFQGQEAEVVIVSMATSNPEDVPRGIDFLYSQNRLNVSLSRAKTLSILVMSPKLLNVRCNRIEQMRLVNTLCWAGEYAHGA